MELILDNTIFGKVRFGVKDIAQAVKTLNTYIEKTRIASSEMDCDFGSVYADTNSDKKIAEISYNGHVIELIRREEREDLEIVNGQIHFKNIEPMPATKENKEFFDIPSMRISRDDIISRFEDTDDFEERQEQIKKLTDEQMQTIANHMTDLMMDDFWDALDVGYESLMTRLQR
jgi:hypothetical protein